MEKSRSIWDYPRIMGNTLESELHDVVKRGVWASFPTLAGFRAWQPFIDAGGTSDIATGSRILARTIKSALVAWQDAAPKDALAVEKLLDLDSHRGKRVLNGPGGLRTHAGQVYNVSWDQFRRKYEDGLLRAFAGFLGAWVGAPALPASLQPEIHLSFDALERSARDLHRTLEQQLSPDLVITMSGPGSFAACYMMQFNPRDIPVVMAVTFPRRNTQSDVERQFARATQISNGFHVETSKWSIYLPGALRHLPVGYRIALVDDRVLTGDAQAAVRIELEGLGYQVSCAALFSAGESRIPDLLVGRKITGAFQMPWGTARGRQ